MYFFRKKKIYGVIVAINFLFFLLPFLFYLKSRVNSLFYIFYIEIVNDNMIFHTKSFKRGHFVLFSKGREFFTVSPIGRKVLCC